MAFGTLDLVVFSMSFVVSVGIGVWFAWSKHKRNNAVQYFLGNRTLSWFPVALSHAVSYLSTYSFVGGPAETYCYGFTYSFLIIGLIVAFIFTTFISAPVLHPLHLTSIYQYFNLRYKDNIARYTTLFLWTMFNLFYSGIVVFGTSIALTIPLGIPYWTIVTLYVCVTAIYTTLGGFITVVWTDVFQTTVMILGTIVIIWKGIMNAGGLSAVIDFNKERLDYFDFRLDPTIRHTFWSVSIGHFLQFIGLFVSQQSMQRISALPNMKTVTKMLSLSILVYTIFQVLLLSQGLVIFGYYFGTGCDPLAARRIKNVNQIVPFAVVDMFGNLQGMSGLFFAALSCASLSTLSSNLNSLGATVYAETKNRLFSDMADGKKLLLSKLSVVIFSVAIFLVALGMTGSTGTIPQIMISIGGPTHGSVAGIFLLSLFWRRATSIGVSVGGFVGFAIALWISLGKTLSPTLPKTPWLPLGPTIGCKGDFVTETNITANDSGLIVQNNLTVDRLLPETDTEGIDKLYSLSYMYIPAVGALTTILVGIIISLLTKPVPQDEMDERCVFKLSSLNKIWIGVNFSSERNIFTSPSVQNNEGICLQNRPCCDDAEEVLHSETG